MKRRDLMERIKALTSQLARAEDLEVIAAVAVQLQVSIAEYVIETERTMDMTPLLFPSPA